MGRECKHISSMFLQLLVVRVMQFSAANCKIKGTVQIFNPMKALH